MLKNLNKCVFVIDINTKQKLLSTIVYSIFFIILMCMLFISGRIYLGDIYYKKSLINSDKDEASGLTERAISYNPYIIEYHNFLANAYKNLATECTLEEMYLKPLYLRKALAQHKTIIKLNPYVPGNWYNLGIAYMWSYDIGSVESAYKQALKSFEHATEISQLHADSWNAIGKVYLTIEEKKLAAKYFKKALSIDSSFDEPKKLLSECND